MKKSIGKRMLACLLAVLMAFSLLPTMAFAAGETTSGSSGDDFLRIFHLDCGRKYFSVSQIEGIIDNLAENGYTHLQLAFGNNGLRFLLDDMSVGSYTDAQVTSAVTSANASYASSKSTDSSVLTEDDMGTIVAYAQAKGIEVIPLLNTPGHMTVLVSAMKELGITSTTGDNMSLTDDSQLSFVKGLLQKYINWFSEKGCTYFNMGADEYSFSSLTSTGYAYFVSYINDVATMITGAGMTPIAFNDGIYYNADDTAFAAAAADISKSIVVAYWCQDTNYASAATLAEEGFTLLNNNSGWYYVLGDALYDKWANGQWGYSDSKKALQNTPCTTFDTGDSTGVTAAGSVLCFWCDYPSYSYESEKVYDLIATMAESNPTYFTETSVTVTDEATNVSVTAPGLEKIEVKAGEAVTVGNGVSKTYSITLNGGEYTGEATVKIPYDSAFDGCTSFTGTVGGDTFAVVKEGDYFIATVPHFSDVEITGYADDSTELTEKTITVTVGQTVTDTIVNADYSENVDRTDLAESIATVSAAYEKTAGGTEEVKQTSITSGSSYYIKNSSGQYLSSSATWVSDISSAALWTATYYYGYYTLTNSGNYLRYNNGSLSTTTRSYRATTWSFSSGTFSYSRYTLGDAYTVTTTDPVDGTTVTFTGVAVGTTYVTVGNIRYTINVVAEDLSGAADLPIQLWITNGPISVTGVTTKTTGTFYYRPSYQAPSDTEAYYVSVSAKNAYGKDGVALATLVPTGVKAGSVTTIDDPEANYVLWKGTDLTSTNGTSGLQYVWQANMCNSGTDFAYVRYYGGEWAVSADRVTWTTVTGEGSTASYASCRDQVIAYYMQRTEITDQMLTDMVDGGDILSNTSAAESPYVILDYAVNANGTLIPDTFPQDGKTLRFHCTGDDADDDGVSGVYRRLYAVMATETSSYEVYMITITPTSDDTGKATFSEDANPTSITYNGTERVIWALTEGDIPDGMATIADDDYTGNLNAGTVTYGGEPILDELYIYNLQGMLVTYYIRGVQTEDSLTVKYVDDTTGETFYTAHFAVLEEGDEEKDFTNALLVADGEAYVVPGNSTLADNTYYIVDPYNAKVYVRSDLTKIPDLHGIYSTGVYAHVKAEIDPNDSKVLILYYEYDSDAADTYKNFVLDFGLPVTVNASDLFENTDDIASIDIKTNGTYGTATATDTSFTYTPDTVLLGTDVVTITVKFNDNSTADFDIGFVRASNVLYEDGFMTAGEGWSNGGSKGNGTLNAEQSNVNEAPYGYDVAYANKTGPSGTQYVATVTESSRYADNLTFTFRGTGFDLIGACGPTTGTLMVRVEREGTDGKLEYVKGYLVDTSFNDSKVGDKDGKIYQVPLVHCEGLENGNYTVTISGAYISYNATLSAASYSLRDSDSTVSAFSDEPDTMTQIYDLLDEAGITDEQIDEIEFINMDSLYGASTYAMDDEEAEATLQTVATPTSMTLEIDGFRVYKSANNTSYAASEQNVEYVNVLDAVQYDDYAAYTETNSDYSATSRADYEGKGGPQNEIYLASGKSVVFNTTLKKDTKVQISARAVSDTTYLNGKELTSNTEMYYEVEVGDNGTITVGNVLPENVESSGLLALGNLKIKSASTTNLLFEEVTDETLAVATFMLRSYSAASEEPETPVEPEEPEEPVVEPFVPAQMTVKVTTTNLFITRMVTVTVSTSSDVSYITVNGEQVKALPSFRSRNKTFVYVTTVPATEEASFEIVAFDDEGLASDPLTETVAASSTGSRWLPVISTKNGRRG